MDRNGSGKKQPPKKAGPSSPKESAAHCEKEKSAEAPSSVGDPPPPSPPPTNIAGEATYYSTLVAFTTTVLSIVLSFVLVFRVYSIQKQDELAIATQKGLEDLNSSLWEFTNPRSVRGLTIANYMQLLQRESWKDKPGSLFDNDIETIKEKFDELSKRFNGNFETPASLLEVRFLLDGLVSKMYTEFPSYRAMGQRKPLIEYDDEFLEINFPACQVPLEKWFERFDLYDRECRRRFSNLSEIIQAVASTESSSAMRLAQEIASKPESGIPAYRLKEIVSDSIARAETYVAFIRGLNNIQTKVSQIAKDIKYYKRFQRRAPSWWIFLPLVLAAVPGTVIPLIRLRRTSVPALGEFCNRHMHIVSPLGFLVGLLVAIYLLIRPICTSITM